MKIIAGALLLLLVGYNNVFSQELRHNVILNLSNIVEIKLKPDAIQTSEFEFTTGDELENNIATNDGANLQIGSNSDWKLNVKSTTANFSYVGDFEDPLMPSTVLKIRNRPDARISLTDEDQEIASGTAGSFEEHDVRLRYIAVPKFKYPAGTYSIDIVYTVTKG